MNEVNSKDVVSFAKVLIALGEAIKRDPNIVLDRLKMLSKKQPSKNCSKQGTNNCEPIKTSELFELAKTKTEEELIHELEPRSVEELRQIISELKFGSYSSKNNVKLAEYIADQLKKRTEDVFKDQ